MRAKKRYGLASLVCALGALPVTGTALAQGVDDIVALEERRIQQARQAQEQIDAVVNTTQARFRDRQAVLKEIENLQAFNTVLEVQVQTQERQLRELRTSISQVGIIQRQVIPLMTRMVDSLEQFIELDTPFFIERRRARVANLRELLPRADLTPADQFRQVLEAWQTENDYGRYPEVYTAEIALNGTVREVDILKIGRIALLYLTPDGRQAGAWDNERREWVPIHRDYHEQIRQGFQAFEGDVSKAFFMIPITPPEEGS